MKPPTRAPWCNRGQVTEIAPSQELFWITDYLTGSRRLLDVAEFEIDRLANPSATEESGI
ncbi:hypothetical protein LJR078_001887 [Arthrobacter sp. LjRoot78]|uniref:hypothetical protein n=1 Tax=Arthrobacter sp. LjRoot78 TaxID=3342338 RepID=UPI003ED0F4CA